MEETMRTKTITITEYTIDELDGDKLEKVLTFRREWMYKHGDWHYLTSDAMETIERGLDWLGYDLRDWAIDFEAGYVNKLHITMANEPEGIKATAKHIIEAWSEIHKRKRKGYKLLMERKDCPFTGVCYDEDFLDPIRNYMTNPEASERRYDLREIAEDCVQSVVKSIERGIEYIMSDKGITEYCKDNDIHFEFDEEGNLI